MENRQRSNGKTVFAGLEKAKTELGFVISWDETEVRSSVFHFSFPSVYSTIT
jgi:hypothetical protein